MKKKDYINISIICSIILTFILVLLFNGYAFASTIDWSNQHYVIPEYFRNLFYETGNPLPNFSLNLGMGQNIFYFSYYGLFSPIILISYLFPYIPMHIFMILISVIVFFTSILLFYKWIKDKYDSNIAFIASILFALNTTFSYHFHRHIMFVIYMPFLLLALKSVDTYFEKKKVIPLIIWTTLMIFTSYYFSVHGIITIGIYTIYYLLKNNKFKIKKLFNIIIPVIIGILLSAILLLPTIYTLINGRLETLTESINLIDLLNPINNFKYTFYNNYYSWGLSFIYILGILQGFISKNKGRIFLSIIMSLFILLPLSSYILNAFMYIDGKCFIPFIPIAILSVCELLKDLLNKNVKIDKKHLLLIPMILLMIIAAIKTNYIFLTILDIILCLLGLYFSTKHKKYNILFIPIIIISITTFILSSTNEKYITTKDLNNINDNKYKELLNIDDDSIYRISNEQYLLNNSNKIYNINNNITTMYSSSINKNYMNFIRNIFQNEIINRDNTTVTQSFNILFNIYSGTKYILTNKNYTLGYKLLKEENGLKLYSNENSLPIAFASNKIMSKREFNTLKYPETIDALLNYIIVDEEINNVYNSNIEKYNDGFTLINKQNIKIEKDNNHYLINANNNSKLKIKLNETLTNKILIVKFNMNLAKKGYACSSNITINGITNALSCDTWKYNNNNKTFEYVFADKTINEFDIIFNKSEYDISNIELYTIDYNNIKNINNNIKELKLNKVKDNLFEGNINIDNDSYLKITIPYDKGFKLFVDNKETNIIKVDKTFIGFKLNKGIHNIKITYESPLYKEGKIISLTTFLGTSIYFITKKISKKKADEN